MTGMLFELLVGGLLLYGLVGLIAALTRARTVDTVLERDAPIFVARRDGHSTVTTRAGRTRSAATRLGRTQSTTPVDAI
jgi:hypothetical protein